MPRRWWVFYEAVALTLLACVRVKFMPFRGWRDRLGDALPLSEVKFPVGAGASLSGVRADISWALHALSRRSGGAFTCLMLAMSARDMLERRSIPYVLILGVRRDKARKNKMDAHAWVLSEGAEIIGGNGVADHTPVAAFGRLGFDKGAS